MLNLIKMDFSIYRSSFLWIVIYALFFAAVYGNVTFIGTISMLCVYIFLFSVFAAEERDKIHLLHKTLPLSDKEIVGSKYIETIIVLLFGMAVGFIISIIMQIIKRFIGMEYFTMDFRDFMPVMAVMLIITILLISVTIPLTYKFGYTKGRYIGIIMWVSIAVGFSSIFYAADSLMMINGLFYIADILVCAALMFVSFCVSVKIYKTN